VEGFGADRYLVDQLDRSTANLYRITPLGEGDTPAGPPVAYVSQEKLEITEEIRFYADEAETEEVFQIKACNILDLGGSRYDVYAGEKQIGALEHQSRASRVRTTWRVRDASNQEIAVARERSFAMAVARRLVDFVPDVGLPIPYNFDLHINGTTIGTVSRKHKLRDGYVIDVSGDDERQLDRRLVIAFAIGLDALQNS
jgi:hypothetical protein